ncbi:hypothetical protein EZE58_01060 [Brevibacterium sp. LS14]|uniref:hypothetical protein n=1 Tax=Brevibacterium sp. LS14 TaxID=2528962 RepID=UPI00142F6416|nr:hypothetical protein [Brevibacterium sp. LS14]
MAYLIDPAQPEVQEVAEEVGGYPYVAKVKSTTPDGICEVEVTVVGPGDRDNGFPIRGRKLIYISAEIAEAHQVDREESHVRASALMPRAEEE